MEQGGIGDTAIAKEKQSPAGRARGDVRVPGLAAASVALLLLLLCTYWFLVGDHRVDRILLAGLPEPSGASDHQGYWSSTAWFFTALGSPEIVFVLASALVLSLVLSGRLRDAVLTVSSIAGGAAAGYVAKSMTAHFRPHHVAGSAELLNTSFPSGHALLATLLFSTAASLAARSAASPAARTWIWTVAAFLVLAVGVSRVYLGTHWPSDVLAGWAAGLLWFAAIERAIGRYRPTIAAGK